MIFQVFCIKNHLIIIKYLIESLKYLSKLERVVLGGSKTFSSVNFESELMILELLKAGSSSSQELDDPALRNSKIMNSDSKMTLGKVLEPSSVAILSSFKYLSDSLTGK